jgi:hypothetical protein
MKSIVDILHIYSLLHVANEQFIGNRKVRIHSYTKIY